MSDPLEGSEKYRVLSELGRGGMGEVFLGEHIALGTRVVIKLLHAELSGKSTLVDRMRLEAQACARLNHPNIVRVTDFDRTPSGRPYFVMEYLPGKSLKEWVDARGGYLSPAEAIELVRQALEGLGAAHAAGLVHRDIKLDNLFVCDPSQPGGRSLIKILDFGVAKVTGGGDEAPAPLMVPTGTGVVVGTPRFFAPEQARGQKLDHRADIYAMGLVLYAMLAGRGPFDDATTITEMAKAHVLKPPDPPSRLAPQPISEALDLVVLRAIAKQPDQRWQSAGEFSAQLERVAQAPSAPASATGRPSHPQMAPTEPAPPAVALQPGHIAPTTPLPSGPSALDASAARSGPHTPPGPAALALSGHRMSLPSQLEMQGPKRYPWPLAVLVTIVCGLVGVVIALAIRQL